MLNTRPKFRLSIILRVQCIFCVCICVVFAGLSLVSWVVRCLGFALPVADPPFLSSRVVGERRSWRLERH